MRSHLSTRKVCTTEYIESIYYGLARITLFKTEDGDEGRG